VRSESEKMPPCRRHSESASREKEKLDFQILTCSTASLTRPAACSSSDDDGEASSMGASRQSELS